MPSRTRTGITRCGCGEKIIRALLDGAIVTLDRQPDSQGLVAATCDALGTWRARRHTPGTAVDVTEHQYAVHTCGAEQPAEPAGHAAEREAWRKAVSAHSARTRAGRRRGKGRPAAGYRAWPGGRG